MIDCIPENFKIIKRISEILKIGLMMILVKKKILLMNGDDSTICNGK